ncbi:Aste57867_16350 [Aphanomyces stellatus]|uniref:Aste57867_16350 protein n=1 Tax=Aphanomyces stellatus TaxID=120398 RepID=A0A485L8F8_9STRA|nr:hypothetical protein As57867_016293 [Aphanomyces stellatus]VFT93126.1 Aste57867_16350 [Aphanomyces stellatus]
MEAWCDWACPQCTLINKPGSLNCDACDFANPTPAGKSISLEGPLASSLVVPHDNGPPPKRMKLSIDDLLDLVSDDEDDMDLKAAIAASALEHMNATAAPTTLGNDDEPKATTINSSSEPSTTTTTSSNSLLKELHEARARRRPLTAAGAPSSPADTASFADALAADANAFPPPSSLIVASLNVWFDEVKVEERICAMARLFASMAPHVIFLQEVTPDMDMSLTTHLGRLGYTAANHVVQAYGEMIFLQKGLPLLGYARHPFDNSAMSRSLHVVETQWFDGTHVRLATSHLESLAQNRTARVAQLKWAFEHLLGQDGAWVFGGDMNLSSKDVVNVPSSVHDAWVVTGRNPLHQHTWDTTVNKNLPGVTFSAKCRFDRLYSHRLRCESFATFAKETLPQSTLFPSDHWGVVASYRFL